MKIALEYGTIVRSDELCNELGVNERCVNEGIVNSNDTLTIEITEENKRILDELKSLID